MVLTNPQNYFHSNQTTPRPNSHLLREEPPLHAPHASAGEALLLVTLRVHLDVLAQQALRGKEKPGGGSSRNHRVSFSPFKV